MEQANYLNLLTIVAVVLLVAATRVIVLAFRLANAVLLATILFVGIPRLLRGVEFVVRLADHDFRLRCGRGNLYADLH